MGQRALLVSDGWGRDKFYQSIIHFKNHLFFEKVNLCYDIMNLNVKRKNCMTVSYKSIQNIFLAACQSSNRSIIHQVKLMQNFLSGQAVKFDLELLALENCSHFQQRVLLAENNIPKGWVST